ncbi:MAG: XTP/dITP diphosphatase [Clostridia bacterium]
MTRKELLTLQVIAATHNKNKLREFREILEPFGFEIISAEEAGFFDEVEETGQTFMENALIKAKAISDACKKAAIADDSGLIVDALNGEPGVYSARYGGGGLDDKGRTALVLKKMENIPDEKRTARFMCAIAFIDGDGKEIRAEGSVEGVITREPSGENGFGYDPVFYVTQIGKTFAQASAEEKNALSHRGRALSKLSEELGVK